MNQLIASLAPRGFEERARLEDRYPRRNLPDTALVTRVAPSPTGFVHLGTIYAAMLNHRLARQSGGLFYLRLEDTDKKREISGGLEQILAALEFYGLSPDEGPEVGGSYGPYVQSQRAAFYLGYAIDLLRRGRAYPCFAVPEELQALHKRQKAAKARPGYYGEYALWRQPPPGQVADRLQKKRPFVLRLRSEGDHRRRQEITDKLKGRLQLPENDLDVPLIKSDGLPTYHLAHVVDDYLMGTTVVLRGEEWLPSLPLHLELYAALGLPPPAYAHFAPLTVLDEGKKRKLSKRRDAAADIARWQASGYPAEAVLEYLTTLASADFEPWRAANPVAPLASFPITFERLSKSRAPLLDQKKIDDVSKNVISALPQPDFERQLLAWTKVFDSEFAAVLDADPAYTARVLSIEREGAARRKDIAAWSQAKEQYFYFFDSLFQKRLTAAVNEELRDVDYVERKLACDAMLQELNWLDDQPTWLNKLRQAAARAGYAPDNQTYQQNPGGYKGSIADFAKIIRVQLTAKNRTPDLYAIMQVMGEQRVRRRLEIA